MTSNTLIFPKCMYRLGWGKLCAEVLCQAQVAAIALCETALLRPLSMQTGVSHTGADAQVGVVSAQEALHLEEWSDVKRLK